MTNIDKLAEAIRRIDGDHTMGAGSLAEKLVEEGWIYNPEIDFEIKDGVDTIYSGEPYYDLTAGGYIKPKEILADEATAQAVVDAAELVESFLELDIFGEM